MFPERVVENILVVDCNDTSRKYSAIPMTIKLELTCLL